MSTGSYALRGAPVAVAGEARVGVLQRMLQRVLAAQERKARVLVREYLATQDDAYLTSLGYGPAEIKLMRSKATGHGPAWL